MARQAKQKVDDPAARPSSPSVRFTALAAAAMMTVAHTTHSAGAHVQPERVVAGERQGGRGVGPVHGQQGEEQAQADLGAELGPLVQSQAPAVADLDPVVGEADRAPRPRWPA